MKWIDDQNFFKREYSGNVIWELPRDSNGSYRKYTTLKGGKQTVSTRWKLLRLKQKAEEGRVANINDEAQVASQTFGVFWRTIEGDTRRGVHRLKQIRQHLWWDCSELPGCSHWKIISHLYQNILVEYRSENQIAVGGKSKYDVRNIREEICSLILKKKHLNIQNKLILCKRKLRRHSEENWCLINHVSFNF